jgi:hypothetical protein
MNVKNINGYDAKVQLFKMSEKWKNDTTVDVLDVDDNGEVSLSPHKVTTKKWRKNCLILSLDMVNGPLSGKKVLLWPLSNEDADAPGVMIMYLPAKNVHIEVAPKHFETYPPNGVIND